MFRLRLQSQISTRYRPLQTSQLRMASRLLYHSQRERPPTLVATYLAAYLWRTHLIDNMDTAQGSMKDRLAAALGTHRCCLRCQRLQAEIQRTKLEHESSLIRSLIVAVLLPSCTSKRGKTYSSTVKEALQERLKRLKSVLFWASAIAPAPPSSTETCAEYLPSKGSFLLYLFPSRGAFEMGKLNSAMPKSSLSLELRSSLKPSWLMTSKETFRRSGRSSGLNARLRKRTICPGLEPF